MVNLGAAGGLANTAGTLGVSLDVNPGLQLGAGGLSAQVQGVLETNALGIRLRIGSGLENSAGTLAISLATNSGLSLNSGDLSAALQVPATLTTTGTATLNAVNRYNATGGTFTITLPSAVGFAGHPIEFKEAAGNTTGVTLAPSASQTIDAAPTLSVGTVARQHTRLISDGANWMIA